MPRCGFVWRAESQSRNKTTSGHSAGSGPAGVQTRKSGRNRGTANPSATATTALSRRLRGTMTPVGEPRASRETKPHRGIQQDQGQEEFKRENAVETVGDRKS